MHKAFSFFFCVRHENMSKATLLALTTPKISCVLYSMATITFYLYFCTRLPVTFSDPSVQNHTPTNTRPRRRL